MDHRTLLLESCQTLSFFEEGVIQILCRSHVHITLLS